MALAIRKTFPVQVGKNTKAVKEADYLSWLHELPCIVTGRFGVEAAHVSFAAPVYGATGRGKSQKSSDRWALPLSPELHAAQHGMNEEEFWKQHNINPHVWCLVLYGIYCERGADGIPIAERALRLRQQGGEGDD